MDINKLMEQAQMMQNNLGKIEEELAETIYEGQNGGSEGVTIRINGRNEVQEVLIGEELMSPDNREMLQDMILLAFNDAAEKAAADRDLRLGEVTGGLNFPGL